MKIKKFPKFTKLMVTWTDIISDSAWHGKEEVEKAQAMRVQTLGFFLQNKRKDIKLAHSVTDDGDSDYTIIPWSVVSNIEEL